jgi:hypothetical protein
MLPFDARPFVSLAKDIGHEQTSIGLSRLTGGYSLTLEQFKTLKKDVADVYNLCISMDMSATKISSKRIADVLAEMEKSCQIVASQGMPSIMRVDQANSALLAQRMIECAGRIKDELEERRFLSLSSAESKLFYPSDPIFGVEFQNKFPSALYELDESAKCLALGRSTASVFHLMRIVEIGIGAIRKSLGILDPIKPSERNWGAILRKISDGISGKGAATWNAGDKAFFEQSYASLDAVKVAWRNSTMHVENKYSPEEAEYIFAVVKGFVKNVASRMDENGLPLA